MTFPAWGRYASIQDVQHYFQADRILARSGHIVLLDASLEIAILTPRLE
jgi:hypothetical protein